MCIRDRIETELTNVLGHDISFEVENRVQEKIDNDAMLKGYKLIIGCLLYTSYRRNCFASF